MANDGQIEIGILEDPINPLPPFVHLDSRLIPTCPSMSATISPALLA